jgi:hypothetical protein
VEGMQNEDGILTRVNPDSSAGIKFKGLTKDWIDFKNKKIHVEVLDEMSRIERDARVKKKDIKTGVFKDCLKDEMRNTEKAHKPRLFSAGSIEFTLLIRKWFGRLQALFMKFRHILPIQIGINATSKEWHALWARLAMYNYHFDGDYASWDGGMLREFQEELSEVMSDFSEEPELTLTLLSYLCETVHVGKDMTYVTTHSMPSGHGITALYNSLINYMYIAYAWYVLVGRHMKGNFEELYAAFDKEIFSPVYGDDNVVGVAESIKDKFNALTFTMVMNDLGLGYTSASKKEHDRPFVRLGDITFLKRGFTAHRTLQMVTGPLDLKTILGMIPYVGDASRDNEITKQKMDNIQRELFLHPPTVYQHYWPKFCAVYKSTFEHEYPERSLLDLQTLYFEGCLRGDLFELFAEGECFRRRNRSKVKREGRMLMMSVRHGEAHTSI